MSSLACRRRCARFACGALLVVWCFASWTLSSKSDPEDYVGVHLHLPDKVAHLIEYAAGGFFAAGAFGRSLRVAPWLAGVAFCVLWGVSDEIHQSFVPHRDMSGMDLAADAAGAALGALAATWLVFRPQAAPRGVDES